MTEKNKKVTVNNLQSIKVEVEGATQSLSETQTESSASESQKAVKKEVGGRGGLDPTRYGDWEKNGRCIDF